MSLHIPIRRWHWRLGIKRTYLCCIGVVHWLDSRIAGVTMFAAGFLVFLSTFMPGRAAALVACMLPITMFVIWLFTTLTHEPQENEPAVLPECPLRNLSPFFRRRFRFLLRGYELTGESIYQFKLLKVKSLGVHWHAAFTTKPTRRTLSLPSLVLPHGVTSSPTGI